MDESPEELRPIPISSIIDEWIDLDSQEMGEKLWGRGKDVYPSYPVLRIILTTLAIDFPTILEEYNVKENAIDKKYGNVIENKFVMYPDEAEERHKNLLILWNKLGPGKIDTKNAYFHIKTQDGIDFSGWEDE